MNKAFLMDSKEKINLTELMKAVTNPLNIKCPKYSFIIFYMNRNIGVVVVVVVAVVGVHMRVYAAFIFYYINGQMPIFLFSIWVLRYELWG